MLLAWTAADLDQRGAGPPGPLVEQAWRGDAVRRVWRHRGAAGRRTRRSAARGSWCSPYRLAAGDAAPRLRRVGSLVTRGPCLRRRPPGARACAVAAATRSQFSQCPCSCLLVAVHKQAVPHGAHRRAMVLVAHRHRLCQQIVRSSARGDRKDKAN
jgi:hypothetical protein